MLAATILGVEIGENYKMTCFLYNDNVVNHVSGEMLAVTINLQVAKAFANKKQRSGNLPCT